MKSLPRTKINKGITFIYLLDLLYDLKVLNRNTHLDEYPIDKIKEFIGRHNRRQPGTNETNTRQKS